MFSCLDDIDPFQLGWIGSQVHCDGGSTNSLEQVRKPSVILALVFGMLFVARGRAGTGGRV